MASIGFIGLGNMGAPMMRNLIKAGHKVAAFDLSEAALAAAAEAGATACTKATDAARGAEVVVSMLPAGAHVKSVMLGEGGLFAAASKGTLFIDSSTIDVATARLLSDEASRAGHALIDAPVSGGVGGAEAGTLTFMVGGADDSFARAEPILAVMGKTIVHAGGPGNGQAAKICNNMLLGISMIGTCEAFALAEKLGLDAQKLFDISSKSSGQNWSMTSYCPVPGPVPASPANRDYKAGFAAAMMLKDLKLAVEAAQTAGASIPLGAEAAQLYAMMAGMGQGGLDFSGIIHMLRGKA
ncbi:3-hydroxyisobutyrate dehydrogenase [Paramagnetospirillum magneticum]|uniref:3-hydroxyisobutyrate dehydrogenase and related beta-hydroxyacid dehydrogenase n=1 Tax=Paramagnetospirillum magneticum (strain ATCC 700264 / AMB-1) TaxID=342108 RepID=Q2W184_PARM1|nr:3-hydroxyisobutyrate dehydrogenase [Paramagnetospirillum magneticum]BAE52391.1 3-hydroxyisobutyrate dehydrogenase and related beta-hydroxyacid dehydrogenase [Paramagnetospirillum magneticum AMB-1]